MTPARLDRWTAALMALMLLVLAAYGLFSFPQLAARWGVSGWSLIVLAAWVGTAGWALATAVRRPARREWIAFAAVALGWRIGSLLLAEPRVSPGDSHWYLVLAAHLHEGRGLVLDEPFMHLPVRALYPPAYPLLLAGWTALWGNDTPSLLALSTLLDLLAAALIARLGQRLRLTRAGIAAGLLYLVWPSTLFGAPLAQKESLELVLVTALALGWVEAWRGDWPLARLAAVIGGAAALLALTQPGLAMLAGLFGLALLPRLGARRLIAVALPAMAVAILAMLPWWWRNWLVFHRFVPLTSAAGLSLWVGNHAGATGNWMPYPRALHAQDELGYGVAATRLATAWMTQHPWADARLTVTKFVRAAGLGESGVVRLAGMRPALPPATAAALFVTEHLAHVAALAGGAIALARRRATPVLPALLAAGVAQLLLFGVWFEFGERHRDFLTPFLLLPVCAMVADAAPRFRPRLRRRTARAGDAAAAPPAA